jgi:hypothetical protein
MKAYLGIGVADTTYDGFLTQQITMLSEAIEAYCGRTFSSTKYVQTFYLEELLNKDKPLDNLTLHHFPLISVEGIVEKFLDTDTGTPVTDFRINKDVSKVIKKHIYGNSTYNFFWSGAMIVEVSYTAGYVSIPTPITQVIYSIVQERYNKEKSGINLNFGPDVQGVSIAGVMSIQYDSTLSSNDRKTPFGSVLGNNLNVLDYYRSDRALVGSVRPVYVENIP